VNKKSDAHILKENNTNLILKTFLAMKTATRRQLAQKTGLSQPTVNSIVQELEGKRVVCSGTFAASAGGRRPKCYTLRTAYHRAATIRVLPHSLEYMVVTIDGAVVLRNSWAVTNEETHITALQALLKTLIRQDKGIRIASIGVPGVVGPGGCLRAIPQVPSLEGVALAQVLQEQHKLPVYVENDMNLVALGSVAGDNDKTGLMDIVFIHLGEGVGAGIVMGGNIIRGYSNFAGEIAYVLNPVSDNKTRKSLESLLAQTDSVARQAQLVSDMVVSLICILNPPVISFGNTLASKEILEFIKKECEKRLPLWTLPSFQLMEDEDATYDRGLTALVTDKLTKQVMHDVSSQS